MANDNASAPLEGKTIFMSGGSRGVGLAIALRAARDGANVALIAKTDEPHPKLPGTIHTAAEEIRDAGGQALPIVGDIRDADAVEAGVAQTVERFGGIDLVVNNASAINLSPMRDLPAKHFDLMQQINPRGTFVVTQACLPHLRESDHAHVLSLSPPISADHKWLKQHSAYTVAKYGMSMITLGLAADEADAPIAANTLWPRTLIATAAVKNLLGGEQAMRRARTPEIYADSAIAILRRDPRECSGNSYIDDEVLAEEGITDLSRYQAEDGEELQLDLFLDDWPEA